MSTVESEDKRALSAFVPRCAAITACREKYALVPESPQVNTTKSKKLLDQMRDKLRLSNYSYETEKSYVSWARRTSSSTPSAIHSTWARPRWRPS